MPIIKQIADSIKVRKLRRAKRTYEWENRQKLDEIQLFDIQEDTWPPELDVVNTYANEIRAIETGKLRRLAEKWNIEIKKDWLEITYSREGDLTPLLTD